jgi:type I site-specific restriction endonuclease
MNLCGKEGPYGAHQPGKEGRETVFVKPDTSTAVARVPKEALLAVLKSLMANVTLVWTISLNHGRSFRGNLRRTYKSEGGPAVVQVTVKST